MGSKIWYMFCRPCLLTAFGPGPCNKWRGSCEYWDILAERLVALVFIQQCLGKCTVRGRRFGNDWKGGSLTVGLGLVARRREPFLFLSALEIKPSSPYTTMLLFEVKFCCGGKRALAPVRLVCRINKNSVILPTLHTKRYIGKVVYTCI